MTAPEVKPATRGCSNYVHYRLILDTDVERCPSCGRILYRKPRSSCAAHSVYCCPDCFTQEEIAEFAWKRAGAYYHVGHDPEETPTETALAKKGNKPNE